MSTPSDEADAPDAASESPSCELDYLVGDAQKHEGRASIVSTIKKVCAFIKILYP